MPAFLEAKLKKQYGAKSPAVWKILNSIGAMRGNKETAKGRAMQRKQERDHPSSKRSTKGATATKSKSAPGVRHAAKMKALEGI